MKIRKVSKRLAKKVLLVGWDAADWEVINPLIDAGKMPTLENLVNGGTISNLSTLSPAISPMLWTSIATGVYADKHGILGFTEPTPDKTGVRPVNVTSRKVKALWNILSQEGMKAHVVGWWPSHPAEPINGVSVSNFYQKSDPDIEKDWEFLEGTVHPKRFENRLKNLRVHPAELTLSHLLPFVPKATEIDQDKDLRLNSIASILSDCSSIHAAATWIMENEPWDLMAVYYDAIDHFSHGFMDYHPPRLNKVSEKDFELYKDVVNGGYIFHDMMLARLLELAGPDTTVIIVSDHGFHSGHLRPKSLPLEPAAPVYEHRDYGILCINGPHIKRDEIIFGSSLLDITPTILTLLGLPVGEDMDGKVLLNAFENKTFIEKIPSWEEVEGDSGMHPLSMQRDPYVAQQGLQQLIDLGYIEDMGRNTQKLVENTIQQADYNLAKVYIDTNRHELALPLLKKLSEQSPTELRYGLRQALCLYELNRINESKIVFHNMKKEHKGFIWASEEMKKLKILQAEKTLTEKEKINFYKSINARYKFLLQTKRDSFLLDLLESDLLLKENKGYEALKKLNEIEKLLPNEKNLLLRMFNAYRDLKQWKNAKSVIDKILNIDSNSHFAHCGLAEIYLIEKKYHLAVEEALIAIGLTYYYPHAHIILGQALINLKMYERAAEAFKVCLSINPNFGSARNQLVNIYEKYLNMPQEAKKLKEFFYIPKNNIDEQLDNFPKSLLRNSVKNAELKNPILIVSGLPRSGTSMIMQMLSNGGLEVYSDGNRKSDIDNPKGYYEHDAVKRIAYDQSWLLDVKNRVVKIVSHLLFHLPARFNYKIIFVLRDIEEILSSQKKMLRNKGKFVQSNASLIIDYQNNLNMVQQWAKENHNVELIYVDYVDVISNPLQATKNINHFTGNNLNIESMINSIDKKLYRSKKIKKDVL